MAGFAPNNQQKPRKYLFIDGNYFQRTIESMSKRIGDDIVIPIETPALSPKNPTKTYI